MDDTANKANDEEHELARVLGGLRLVTDLGVAVVASDLVSIALGPSPYSFEFDNFQRAGLAAAALGLIRIVYSFVILHQNSQFDALLVTTKLSRWHSLITFDAVLLLCSVLMLCLVGLMAFIASHPADFPSLLRVVAGALFSDNYGASQKYMSSIAVSCCILGCILGIYPLLLVSELIIFFRLKKRSLSGRNRAFILFPQPGKKLLRTARVWCIIDALAIIILLAILAYFVFLLPKSNYPLMSGVTTLQPIPAFGANLGTAAPVLEGFFTIIAIAITIADIYYNAEFYSPSPELD